MALNQILLLTYLFT